ncbi:hypothetical protein LAZ67_5001174 [Cordylochernes scorpioides]|uniref:Integrase catalytic domain-containing protein n=1 Tax=Cordylochernes scorpioides TaxID=51811 RepID=A0ABY6KIX1_9ARAC|nr:hypothetical protein LAZ67_5001174 [Cordylochernes scorpioides]
MSKRSPGGSLYFVSFKDDFSRFRVAYFIRHKSDVLEKFKEFVKIVRTETGNKIKRFRTDNGTEFLNKNFSDYLKSLVIVHELTAPYTPEQNGISERDNRTIVESARCLLHGRKMPLELWAEAVNTAVYLLNRCTTKVLGNSTPYEIWYKRKPSILHLKTFGCNAYVHIPKDNRKKLDKKKESCRYPLRDRIREKEQSSTNCTRAISYACYVHDQEPLNYEDAIVGQNSKKWKLAMDDEFNSLMKNQTWMYVTLPSDRKAIACKWVYKIKQNADGSNKMFKARLVAKGYSQKSGLDYGETFSPVDNQEIEEMNKIPYRQTIGSLMYLMTGTRPDMPTQSAGQKQNCVSLSTTESEYIAASKATKEAIWLRQLLLELHQEQVKPTTIFCNNQSCIRLVHNPEYHKRTKHIDISYHSIRDHFQKHAIDLLYVCSNDQAADLFTKALPPERYRRLRSQLGLFETTKCLSEVPRYHRLPRPKSRQDSGRQGTSKQIDHCLYRKMEQGREEDPKEPMESDPDSESGENTTFPKKETTLGRTQEVSPNHEDVTPPPPVSDVLGRSTTTLHQLSAVTGLSRDVELPRYNGSYEAQSFFTNYDAQADRAQLQYSTRLRKPANLLQAPLRVTNTRAYPASEEQGGMLPSQSLELVERKRLQLLSEERIEDIGTTFDFIAQRETIDYLNDHGRIVFCVRGFPGSGKESLRELLEQTYPTAKIFCAKLCPIDIDQSDRMNCHLWCIGLLIEALKMGHSPLILANSFIREFELEHYLIELRAFACTIIMMDTSNFFEFDIKDLITATHQKLYEEYFSKRLPQWCDYVPWYTGWFLNPTDSYKLFQYSIKVLTPISNTLETEWIIDLFYGLEERYSQVKEIFCITTFCNAGFAPGSLEYYLSNDVLDWNGRMSDLNIVGFLIDQDLLLAIVSLTQEQQKLVKNLSEEDEEEESTSKPSTSIPKRNVDYTIDSPPCYSRSTLTKTMNTNHLPDHVRLEELSVIVLGVTKDATFPYLHSPQEYLGQILGSNTNLQDFLMRDDQNGSFYNVNFKYIFVPFTILQVKSIFTGLF